MPGGLIRVWDLLGTRLAILRRMDMTYWEPRCRAELLVASAAGTGEYNVAMEHRGGWSRVAENPAPALCAGMRDTLTSCAGSKPPAAPNPALYRRYLAHPYEGGLSP